MAVVLTSILKLSFQGFSTSQSHGCKNSNTLGSGLMIGRSYSYTRWYRFFLQREWMNEWTNEWMNKKASPCRQTPSCWQKTLHWVLLTTSSVITSTWLQWANSFPVIYYTIAIVNVIAIPFYGMNRNCNRNCKNGYKPILEPNGNCNNNRVINRRCEWTLNPITLWYRLLCTVAADSEWMN